MNNKLGLIGAGEFGNFATRVLDMLPDFSLEAVCDTNEDAALSLAKKYKAKIYSNYLDLLKDENIDIVLINTPNFLHAQMVTDCINHGKRVLCEKPLGINMKETEQVIKNLDKYKGILLVNYLLPRSSIYQKLKKIISQETYGKLKYIHIENLATESTIKSEWYWQKEKSGGWFLTADIHFYDLMIFLLDQKINVVSADEFVRNNRTSAILTGLESTNTRVDIYHDFSVGYERADFNLKLNFEKAEIKIKGWIPISMEIKTAKNKEIELEKMDREIIYQQLVAENIKELAKINHKESLNHINKVLEGSRIAFSAQKIADKNGVKNG